MEDASYIERQVTDAILRLVTAESGFSISLGLLSTDDKVGQHPATTLLALEQLQDRGVLDRIVQNRPEFRVVDSCIWPSFEADRISLRRLGLLKIDLKSFLMYKTIQANINNIGTIDRNQTENRVTERLKVRFGFASRKARRFADIAFQGIIGQGAWELAVWIYENIPLVFAPEGSDKRANSNNEFHLGWMRARLLQGFDVETRKDIEAHAPMISMRFVKEQLASLARELSADQTCLEKLKLPNNKDHMVEAIILQTCLITIEELQAEIVRLNRESPRCRG